MGENGNGATTAPKTNRYSIVDVEMFAEDFDFTLGASVHDALWGLTMQWKLNEFKGEDAGSTVYTRVHSKDTKALRFKPLTGGTQPFDSDIPLEARVEREAIQFDLALDLRFGRYWRKLLDNYDLLHRHSLFVNAFAIEPSSTYKERSNRQASRVREGARGRIVRGGTLIDFIQNGSDGTAAALASEVNTGSGNITSAEYSQLQDAINDFMSFYNRIFTQPDGDSSWNKNRLEYSFESSISEDPSGSQTVLSSKEYHGGRLDWYNFDVDPVKTNLPNPSGQTIDDDVQVVRKRSFIPSPVTFPGMPTDRWWEMQDGNMNFASIKSEKTGLVGMMAKDFILNYNNDWSLIPYPTEVGSVTEIKSIIVQDVFGDRIYVGGELPLADTGPDIDDRWSMFKMNEHPRDYYNWDERLFIPPTLPTIMEGANLDKVLFLRDQVANLVWAIEEQVPDELAQYLIGKDAAAALETYLNDVYDDLPSPPTDDIPKDISTGYEKAAVRYQALTYVPENWIPFIPQTDPNNSNRIDLRRATLPRVMEGKDIPYDEGQNFVEPRTKILREGLDQSNPEGYVILSEEIPRSGIYVTRSFQRCRWHDGRVYLWMGRRKFTGRGEGLSGLNFDSLVSEQNIEPPLSAFED